MMPEHNFQLTITGALTDDRLDELAEAGCDDATFSSKGDLTFADFDREAPSLLDAVTSAIADVEKVPGLEVLHIDPDELVWASEIGERTGRSRQNVDQLIRGQRGPGGFPRLRAMHLGTRCGGGQKSRRCSRPMRHESPTPSELSC